MDKDVDRIVNVIHALREMGVKEPETLVHSYLAQLKKSGGDV